MKYVLFALALLGTSFAHAGPATYHAYCMVPKVGTPPQMEVTLKKGESKEIWKDAGYSYQVSYGVDPNKNDVVALTVLDTASHMQNESIVSIGKVFPKAIDLVSAPFGISCLRMD